MVWYLVRSLDPELRVAVGWVPVLGSFIGRVEGVPTGALLDPDRPTVAWFGSRQGELQTVQDLQDAIGDYAILGTELRAALEADRLGRRDDLVAPAAMGPLGLAGSSLMSSAEQLGLPEPSTRRALLELALMVGILLVVLILGLLGIMAGAGNR
jgi:hypothetical protein